MGIRCRDNGMIVARQGFGQAGCGAAHGSGAVRRLIASEAAWRLDIGDVVEVEIGDGLQGLAGRAVAGGFGQRVEPLRVLGLQGEQLGYCLVPSLRPVAPIGGSAVADEGCIAVAGTIAGLAPELVEGRHR